MNQSNHCLHKKMNGLKADLLNLDEERLRPKPTQPKQFYADKCLKCQVTCVEQVRQTTQYESIYRQGYLLLDRIHQDEILNKRFFQVFGTQDYFNSLLSRGQFQQMLNKSFELIHLILDSHSITKYSKENKKSNEMLYRFKDDIDEDPSSRIHTQPDQQHCSHSFQFQTPIRLQQKRIQSQQSQIENDHYMNQIYSPKMYSDRIPSQKNYKFIEMTEQKQSESLRWQKEPQIQSMVEQRRQSQMEQQRFIQKESQYPQTEFKQSMKESQYPQTEFKQSMKEFQYPQTEFKQSIKEPQYPQTEFKQSMKETQYPQTEYKQSIKGFESPKTNFKQSVKEFESPKIEIKQSIKEFESPKTKFKQSIKQFESPKTEFKQPYREFKQLQKECLEEPQKPSKLSFKTQESKEYPSKTILKLNALLSNLITKDFKTIKSNINESNSEFKKQIQPKNHSLCSILSSVNQELGSFSRIEIQTSKNEQKTKPISKHHNKLKPSVVFSDMTMTDEHSPVFYQDLNQGKSFFQSASPKKLIHVRKMSKNSSSISPHRIDGQDRFPKDEVKYEMLSVDNVPKKRKASESKRQFDIITNL